MKSHGITFIFACFLPISAIAEGLVTSSASPTATYSDRLDTMDIQKGNQQSQRCQCSPYAKANIQKPASAVLRDIYMRASRPQSLPFPEASAAYVTEPQS